MACSRCFDPAFVRQFGPGEDVTAYVSQIRSTLLTTGRTLNFDVDLDPGQASAPGFASVLEELSHKARGGSFLWFPHHFRPLQFTCALHLYHTLPIAILQQFPTIS